MVRRYVFNHIDINLTGYWSTPTLKDQSVRDFGNLHFIQKLDRTDADSVSQQHTRPLKWRLLRVPRPSIFHSE